MDVAAALAAHGAPHGTLVEVGHQSRGRGRLGRPWTTGPGDALLTSWIVRDTGSPRNTGVLSPLAALAVLRVVRKLVPDAPVGFKWPNDVLIDDRKLAGILLTSRMQAGETVIIAGIGVNVAVDSVPDLATSTSLAEWRPDVITSDVGSLLAEALERAWTRFAIAGALGREEHAELEALLAWRGEEVEVRAEDRSVAGRIVGLDLDGALRMRDRDRNDVVSLHAGEVVRGPRRVAATAAEPYRILP